MTQLGVWKDIRPRRDTKWIKVFRFKPRLINIHPDAPSKASVLGRTLTEAFVFNGKIYFGYGDTFRNTGVVDVYEYDPIANTWKLIQANFASERIGRYAKVGDQLWYTADDTTSDNFIGYGRAGVGNQGVFGPLLNDLTAHQSSAEDALLGITGVAALVDTAIERSVDRARDGVASFKVTRTATTAGPTEIKFAARPAIPGMLYTVLFEAFSAVRDCSYLPYMVWLDINGNVIKVETNTVTSNVAVNTWNLFGMQRISPPGTASLELRLRNTTDIPQNESWYTDKETRHRYGFIDWVLGGSQKGSSWRPVHLYDVKERQAGEIYAVGSFNAAFGAALLKTVDNGVTWTPVITPFTSSTTDSRARRFYNLGVLNGKVYTVMGDIFGTPGSTEQYNEDIGEDCYIYDGAKESRGSKLEGFIKPLTFKGLMVYRSKDKRLMTYDGVDVVNTVRNATCVDHFSNGNEMFVMQNGLIYKSKDLSRWIPVGTYPDNAASFVVLDSAAYFGMPDGQVYSVRL